MNVLIGCEESGRVRRAFRARGHNAWSNDLKPARDGSRYHYQMDVRKALGLRHWDLFIVFPDCRYLCSSGLHWNTRRPARRRHTREALAFVRELFDADVDRMALENSIGCISTQIRLPDQIIQPHEFGDDASKGTCLWLRRLPLLVPTDHVPPRMVNGKPRWANQTDSGQNRLAPSDTRAADRARTYPGIAWAMADQWGSL